MKNTPILEQIVQCPERLNHLDHHDLQELLEAFDAKQCLDGLSNAALAQLSEEQLPSVLNPHPPSVLNPHPQQCQIQCLRLDRLPSQVNGNKPFKQAGFLALAKSLAKNAVLTFGGPYSNHVHALAAACADAGLKSIGVIRGLHKGDLNPTLSDAQTFGMQLHFVSRQDYRQKNQADFIASLEALFGSFLCVPEGGGGLLGAWGAQAIGAAIAKTSATLVVLPLGTGATLAGILAGIAAAKPSRAIHVVAVPVLNLQGPKLDAGLSIPEQIESLYTQLQAYHRNTAVVSSSDLLPIVKKASGLESATESTSCVGVSWELLAGFEFGGYGKCPETLKTFISSFEQECPSLNLDPVYTAKAMFALLDVVLEQKTVETKNVLFVHTGGLQGRRGFKL